MCTQTGYPSVDITNHIHLMNENHKFQLFEFSYFPKYEEAIRNLAENLADPEIWDFSDATQKKYPILKNYLEHTFRKLKIEKKIAYTRDSVHACFNTGLVTRLLEPIFALFEINRNTQIAEKRIHHTVSRGFYKRVMHSF